MDLNGVRLNCTLMSRSQHDENDLKGAKTDRYMTHCDYCRHVDGRKSFFCQTCGYSLKNLVPKINPVFYIAISRGNGKIFEQAKQYLELIESGVEAQMLRKSDLNPALEMLLFLHSDKNIFTAYSVRPLIYETRILQQFISKGENTDE